MVRGGPWGESRYTWSFITLHCFKEIFYNTKILIWKITNSYTTNLTTKILFFYIWVIFLHLCLCTMCVSVTHRAQKRVWQPLRLKLQLWTAMEVPRTKPRSSGTAASALNCCAITPAPTKVLLIKYLHYDHEVVQRNVLSLIIKTQLYINSIKRNRKLSCIVW